MGHSLTIEELSRIDSDALPEDGGPEFNRLIFEKSPYLLQHATNPVDWRPWNDDALQLAIRSDRPIFLSIGYSTCHWCHVMAEESFADPDVAAVINRSYIPIKVDREERPDIDNTYMQACQMMTGSGGWPLNLILTPARLPFFAATYLPKNDRHGMTGLTSLLGKISDLWHEQRDRIETSGQQVLDILAKSEQIGAGQKLFDESIFKEAVEQYRSDYDPVHGGFGHAPKFPAPHNLSLLLRCYKRLDDPDAEKMALGTLRSIRHGGIYDQLGGGIHRYSVDERWLVPHFEKMLYDQGLLIHACIDAWQCSGDEFFRSMAIDTAEYIVRDLKNHGGGFCCGHDADTEGREGTTYLWSTAEIERHFDPETARSIIRMFGMSPGGNFEGENILYLPEGLDEDLMMSSRKVLLPLRMKRRQPHLDDKVITSWNGLTVAALARLGALSGRTEFIDHAADAAAFVKKNLLNGQGRLLRRWRDGASSIYGFLEDYACLTWGLTELYQARFEQDDLGWAVRLAEEMLEIFSDGSEGLQDTGRDAEKVLIRGRNLQDGAFPSGNGTAVMVLIRLGLMTGREDLKRAGENILQKNSRLISHHPSAFAVSLSAFDYLAGPAISLVLATDGEEPVEFLECTRSGFHPRLTTLVKRGEDPALEKLAPLAAKKASLQGQPTAWPCTGTTCHEPVTETGRLAPLLRDY